MQLNPNEHDNHYLSEKHRQAFEKVEEEVARELVVEDSTTEVYCLAVLRQSSPDGHRRNGLNDIHKKCTRHILLVCYEYHNIEHH